MGEGEVWGGGGWGEGGEEDEGVGGEVEEVRGWTVMGSTDWWCA
jgi:hypothetical protein